MRAAVLLIAAAVLGGAPAAQAGVHMHLPKKHRHSRDPAADTGPSAPTSDVPDPVWANGRAPH